MVLVNSNVRVMGYEDPAFEGNRVTFTCPSGQILDGSNSSTCMGNGEWEPDPKEVDCINEVHMTTSKYCIILQIHST